MGKAHQVQGTPGLALSLVQGRSRQEAPLPSPAPFLLLPTFQLGFVPSAAPPPRPPQIQGTSAAQAIHTSLPCP